MGCSNDDSVKVDHEETNRNPDEDSTTEKEFQDFEEYNSKSTNIKNSQFNIKS